MKNDLLELVNQIEHIKSLFHISGGNGMPQFNVVHDNPEFSVWKQEVQLELQDIYDRTRDKFIWNTLTILEQDFNGWKDQKSFNELSGSLLAIRKNIDKYYSDEINTVSNIKEENTMSQKSPKIFISHSSQDKEYVTCLVDFLEDIGLRQEQLFCSSVPGYDIPLGEDIYDYLKNQFQKHDLHVILVLSNNYYQSVACMNEMGAAWVLQNKYTVILLPGFEFKEIQGAINPRQIGLKLDSDLTEVKEKLGQLKEVLSQEFGLSHIPDTRWERKRDSFIDTITRKSTVRLSISNESVELLQAACEADDGTILKSEDLSGTYIEANGKNFIISQERREVAKWENALSELVNSGFVQERGLSGSIYVVTQKGYDCAEQLKK
ncbi:MAG: toll/interleukin-1 receptor domain-containing protein [Enterocloster citroniae]|nr:toll/interleukin-1 receptor domain-containing protein [Enterocloster citroniae]